MSAIDEWEQRIEAEFRQCPGLRLTRAQAQRLWDMRAETLKAVLDRLIARGVLRQSENAVLALNGGCCRH